MVEGEQLAGIGVSGRGGGGGAVTVVEPVVPAPVEHEPGQAGRGGGSVLLLLLLLSVFERVVVGRGVGRRVCGRQVPHVRGRGGGRLAKVRPGVAVHSRPAHLREAPLMMLLLLLLLLVMLLVVLLHVWRLLLLLLLRWRRLAHRRVRKGPNLGLRGRDRDPGLAVVHGRVGRPVGAGMGQGVAPQVRVHRSDVVVWKEQKQT